MAAYNFGCSANGIGTATDANGSQYPVCTDGTGAWVQQTSFADMSIDQGSFNNLMEQVFLTLAIAYCINLIVKTFGNKQRR